jgi:hypothetical protein
MYRRALSCILVLGIAAVALLCAPQSAHATIIQNGENATDILGELGSE